MVKILLDCRRQPIDFWETEDGLFFGACRSLADAIFPTITWLEPSISGQGVARGWRFPYRDPWLRRFAGLFGRPSGIEPFIQRENPSLSITIGDPPEPGTSIPTISWLAGSFDQELLSGRLISTRKEWKSLARCSGILVGSVSAEQFLIDRLPRLKGRIRMLAPFPANLHRPLDPVQKQLVRERYAEGRDYFLASLDGAEVADLVALLLAFAVFKKRQRSNMALILINVPRSILEDFAEKKDSYRHREDLKWLTVHAPVDRSELLASAYTLLLPSSGGNPLLTLAAFSGRVPVISASVPRQDSFWEASVLHSNLRDPEDLAGQMIALYKDESIRTKLINRGDEERKRCNPEQSCSQFLELIGEVLRLPAEMTIHGKFAGKT